MSSAANKRKASSSTASDSNDAKVNSAKVARLNNTKINGDSNQKDDDATYDALSLADIRARIAQLRTRVPIVPPEGLDDTQEKQVKGWAAQLQAVVEEFNLLLCCISAATYKWGSERSGAADQNLSVLSGELSNAQEQIASTITPRLTNVLAPVVDLVVDRVVTKKINGEEVKQNFFANKQVDPDFLQLCRTILCRNSRLMRQVVLANFHKIDNCIGDYLNAQLKDSQHDSRGFAY